VCRIGVAKGGEGAIAPPKFLGDIVNLCFETRFSNQNSVIRLKSNISPQKKFLGWLRHWCAAEKRDSVERRPEIYKQENRV